MHVLETLTLQQKLLCPETGTPVLIRDGRAVSEGGRDFGRATGPLNLLVDYRRTLSPAQVPAGEIARVRTHLGLPEDPSVDAEIAEAIAATGIQFSQGHLSAESGTLTERFQIPAFELEASAPPDEPESRLGRLVAGIGRAFARPEPPPAPPPAPRFEHVSNSVGERLTCGQEVWRNVRVRNAGAALPAGTLVRTSWTGPEGTALPDCTMSTPLPVAFAPGLELTLGLKVRAPARTGPHTLHVTLAAGEAAAAPFADIPVTIVLCEQPVFEYAYYPETLDYQQEHEVAMSHLIEYLQRRPLGPDAVLLEVGGGVHPTGHALAYQVCSVVSSDISHAQSILGDLYVRHCVPPLRETFGFISCDGTRVPVADATFDGAMFFSAFHHFADPRALLKEMKRVVKAEGFIFIGCDCCVPGPEDPLYRLELERGINEQVWTLAEYGTFFREAKLRVAHARIDSHTLKAVLVRDEA